VVPPRLLADQLGLSGAANRALVFLLRYAVPLGIVAASILPILFERR
jgi:hypothetical protein